MTKLLATNYRTHIAYQFHESLSEQANTAYYVYTGVHRDVIGDIPTPKDDTRELVIDAYRNMIFGKRVREGDCSMIVRYIPYEADKVFAMYDDTDENLFKKDFFCMVDEGSFVHVYKCLNNNFGLPSTIEPAFAFVSAGSNYIFETSDGYVWKYMYSVTEITRDKFITQSYFPVVSNTAVANAAIRGCIDIIHIEQNDLEIPGGGKKYDNYVSGTFTTTQLRVNGNNQLYAISNTAISFQEDFYNGCLIYLSGGTGAGQYTTVDDYFHNANGNFIVIRDAFPIAPINGTTWEIYPQVTIKGSGTESVVAVARALVNSTGSNSVYKIEMLEKGEDYDYASANIEVGGTISEDINFVPVELRPIYAPMNGHGSEPEDELGSDAVEISVRFANSESNTLLVDNRYQQIGLLKDPKFSNVFVQISNAAGTFEQNESVFKLNPLRVNANVNISNTSAVITGQTSVLSNVSIVDVGDTGSYVPQDVMAISGGTPVTTAKVKVLTTQVMTAAIANAGSGYTPGTFSANLNLGTPTTNATFNVTANATGNCNTVVITNPGVFTANPPFLANCTPIGGANTSLRLRIEMGLNTVMIFDPGAYAVIPTNLATNIPVVNTGNGVGAELLIAFTPTLTSDFQDQFDPGDYVYITNPEETLQQLAVINTITNASYMTIAVNGFFNCSVAQMYLPQKSTTAEVVQSSNSSYLVLTEVDEELNTADLLVGLESGAKAQVNAVSRNGTQKDFNSFIQLYKYEVAMLSDVFVENERVYQGTSVANATAIALIHSIVTAGQVTYLYTSNQVGQFTQSDHIQGEDSFAVADVTASYSPELKFGSGDVLYIENFIPVNRADDQTETFQIILNF